MHTSRGAAWRLPVALIIILMTTTAASATNWAEPSAPVISKTSVGGPNTFVAPLETTADLQRTFVEYRDDLVRVLELAGWPGDAGTLFAAVAAGQVEETELPIGGRLEWMARRRQGRTVEVEENVRWDGDAPLRSFLVRAESAGSAWTFLIPKKCGNLSLLSRVGTSQITIALDTGDMELVDADGNLIKLGPGQAHAFSAAIAPTASSAGVEVGVPTQLDVSEGSVEFRDPVLPIAVILDAGNSATRVMKEGGEMGLTLPDTNTGRTRIRIGDAIGTISAGSGVTASWTPPVCRVNYLPTGDCVPMDVVVDGRSTAVEGDSIFSLTVVIRKPDGDLIELGPAGPDKMIWRTTFDQAGDYSMHAVAVSNNGLKARQDSTVSAVACKPPPPTTAINTPTLQIDTTGAMLFDGSGSHSDGGSVERILVTVIDQNGNEMETREMQQPFQGKLHLREPGRYTVRAVAVDNFGQQSEDPWEEIIVVERQTVFSLSGFGGFGARTVKTGISEDGVLFGGRASVARRIRSQFEFVVGLAAIYEGSIEDLQITGDFGLGWLREDRFLEAGFGLWDLGQSSSPNLYVRTGMTTPWQPPVGRAEVFGDFRHFFKEFDGDIPDNFAISGGLRVRFE